MKDLDKLKQEQQELKLRVENLADFINSAEYYNCPIMEQTLLRQQRLGMEVYLDSITKRIYGSSCTGCTDFGFPLLLAATMNSSFGHPSKVEQQLQEMLDKD